MPSTHSLLATLKEAYPHVSFTQGDDFQWDHTAQTVMYPPADRSEGWEAQLLHEVAHAILQHQRYNRDVELLGKERDAWQYALTTLAPLYGIILPPEVIKSAMDSYRDWLHTRSTCPRCNATGMETIKHTYTCPACQHQWRVNEARICGLRRYHI